MPARWLVIVALTVGTLSSSSALAQNMRASWDFVASSALDGTTLDGLDIEGAGGPLGTVHKDPAPTFALSVQVIPN